MAKGVDLFIAGSDEYWLDLVKQNRHEVLAAVKQARALAIPVESIFAACFDSKWKFGETGTWDYTLQRVFIAYDLNVEQKLMILSIAYRKGWTRV
jgi:hypothetical protein